MGSNERSTLIVAGPAHERDAGGTTAAGVNSKVQRDTADKGAPQVKIPVERTLPNRDNLHRCPRFCLQQVKPKRQHDNSWRHRKPGRSCPSEQQSSSG
jgi:hypothetical protein